MIYGFAILAVVCLICAQGDPNGDPQANEIIYMMGIGGFFLIGVCMVILLH